MSGASDPSGSRRPKDVDGGRADAAEGLSSSTTNDASQPPPTTTATTIQLDSMSLEELHRLQQEEEGRMQALSGRYAALRQALARIQRGSAALTELAAAAGTTSSKNEAKEVMVPLTESVYVAGKIKDGNKLLVELGTGYYAEKSQKEALAFLERKERIVQMNLDNLQSAIRATGQNVEAIRITMQGKVLEIRAKQEGVRHREVVENS
jgi:prefoldin alpha subunit